MSISQGTSKMRLKVAIKSSQKKKLYLYSSFTQHYMSNSILKSPNAIIRMEKKNMSESLLVNQCLMSELNNAYKVAVVINIITNYPSMNSLIC